MAFISEDQTNKKAISHRPAYFFRIFKYLKWLTLLLSISSPVTFAVESKQPLEQSGLTLVVANSKAWKPFSYIDKTGEPSGLLIDLWKEFAKANHIKVSFVLTDWQESIELVKQGKADVHAGLLWSNERADFFDFGRDLSKLEGQLFIENSLLKYDLATVIQAENLGVIKGSYEDSFIQNEFPQAKLVHFDNNEQMLRAALKNQINMFVADFQVANFYLYTAKSQSAFSPAKHLYSAAIRPAVTKGNAHLLQYIRNGFENVDDSAIDRVQRKWLHVETVYPNYLVPAVVISTIVIIGIYIVQLKRTVLYRTRELHKVNEELRLLVGKDPLTGIANRRFFIEDMQQKLSHNRGDITLLLFDVDKFKSVNDIYGHHIGDQVLQGIVDRITNILSDNMTFARIGGEEFSIFVVGYDFEQSRHLASKIQSHVSAQHINTDIGKIATSVSLGGVHTKMSGVASSTLMRQADLLMYQAKNKGRNRFEFDEFIVPNE